MPGALDTEVVVVGAGVMGLATARALAAAGRDVTVVEQFRDGHARGSSHGSSRIFRLSYPEVEWVRLAQAALPLWRELERECGEQLLELSGCLDFRDWGAYRDALAACGAAFELLDGTEIARRFPLRAEPGEIGLLQPDGGIVHADRALRAFRTAAVAAGARIVEETRVNAIDEHADGVTAAGFRAHTAVVTAGAWVGDLVELDVRPTRETIAYLPYDEPIPSLVDRVEDGPAGELAFALTAPGIGVKAGFHHGGPVTDPDEPGVADAGLAAAAGEWAARRIRGVAPEPVRVETCLYTNRPDERFVLERRGRIVVGSACSGHGFKFAPVVGNRVAALAVEPL